MAKGKLILICQSGGEFVKNDNGSLTYTGGEAQAVNVNSETSFDDLKLKLAELCNLEYKSVSIKYFLPGNTRTLITLSNDKDLRRMLDFHGNSITADVFIMGREGFNKEDLEIYTNSTCRDTGVKVAESVNPVIAPTPITSFLTAAATPVGTPASHVATRRTSARKKATTAATDSVTGVNATAKKGNKAKTPSSASSSANTDDSSSGSPTPVAAKSIAYKPIEVDMSATPADTVKKRRRTASWKFGANGPTIVAVADDAAHKRSRKKSSQILVSDNGDDNDYDPGKYGIDTSCQLTYSDEMSLEKLVASWRDGITGIGQDFKDVYEFRDALQKYAIAHRFVYKLKKNDSTRASGRCAAEGCSWRIHASWFPAAQSFRIKKLNGSHTCGGESWKSAHPTKNWLVNIIKDRLRDSPHHKPKEIANAILQDFGIELNYTQVWRGIEDAREQLQGSYKEAYNQLPWYCDKIVETNPGSFAKLVISDDKRFEGLFVSFHASVHGFEKGCRPLLFLEATPVKSKFQEILLTATALDGNDCFFPVAFAIVDAESGEKWLWFLEQLKSALPASRSMTFVSDKETGLKDCVLQVFGNAYHGYSIYHLLDSFKKSVKGPFHGDGKGSLPGYFIAAAHAVRLVGFRKFTEQIKNVSSQAYDWVMQIPPEYWTTTSLKGERHNQITENVAESYIKLMEEVRELPITQKIDALISVVGEMMTSRQTDASQWSTKLTPLKNAKLQEETVDARGLKVLISSDTLFEVHNDATHVVDLSKWECTCLEWQTTGLPCRHAIAVFNYTHKNVYDYCSKYFTVDSFRLTYSESINPVPTIGRPAEKEESTSDTVLVLPPFPSRSPNQPKEREAKSPGTRSVSCSKCKEEGHNKASCKNSP
ncbi:uncharacterized protein LOC127795565 isoform X2 [Diospyros lotus]|uniref:uncharacterized protein LOC127795565 isoform X2 n=1 Tax=Diospyros lotus TaxID=55363 RepID=UPI0022553AD6|nr:uncharacterized protein LOC127795565 isoform X2 [Diospyros lotus]